MPINALYPFDVFMTLSFVILSILILKVISEVCLLKLNERQAESESESVPEAFQDSIDLPTYRKSLLYTRKKMQFGFFEKIYEGICLAIFLFSGILPASYSWLTSQLGISIWGQSLVLCLVTIGLSLPSVPVEWWYSFKIEGEFGFNRSSLRLWITDKIKGLCIGLLLGYPLLCALLLFFEKFPQTWWVWGFIIFFTFQLLMLILYPRLILPLFNKLAPLEAGELKTRLLRLAERAQFKAKSIFVIDGSKRSTHSNAYFTGFGRFRQIVLFDTLLAQLEPIELEAVLAHEIGHYKRGHIPKMLCLSACFSFLGFALTGWLAHQSSFYVLFGFDTDSGIVPALLLFSLLIGLITFWLTPILNLLSRKFEYEADDFAKKVLGTENPLISSLRKLHEKNLSQLYPHRYYSTFYYSHPTLIEREQKLRSSPH